MIKAKYIVYKRAGKFRVCREDFKDLLEDNEIVKICNSFKEAERTADDLNFTALLNTHSY